MNTGWIGIDLDGTLAEYHGWVSADHIGTPIAPMVNLVKDLLKDGRTVKIFTARVSMKNQEEVSKARTAINKFCRENFGRELEIVYQKDMHMEVLYDDRCIQVEKNTGRLIK